MAKTPKIFDMAVDLAKSKDLGFELDVDPAAYEAAVEKMKNQWAALMTHELGSGLPHQKTPPVTPPKPLTSTGKSLAAIFANAAAQVAKAGKSFAESKMHVQKMYPTVTAWEADLDDVKMLYSDKDIKASSCGSGGPGAPGFQPGNTCAGEGAFSPFDSTGKIPPGTVGGASGVDTSDFKYGNSAAQWAMKKIWKMEDAVDKGESLTNLLYDPSKTKQLNKYQKAVLKAQANLQKKQASTLLKPKAGMPTAKDNPDALDTSTWKKLGGSLGTEKGGLYEDANGKKWYVKTPDDPARVHNELMALKLYELAGANAVKGQLIEMDGKPALATEWVEGSQKIGPQGWMSVKNQVDAAPDYAIHAWLNNRDAVGAGSENPMDNIRKDANGKMIMIDAGGSLDWKGQGGGGKKDFKPTAPEWETLRQATKNESMAAVFGQMTPNQLKQSAQKLAHITNEDITKIVNKYGAHLADGNGVDTKGMMIVKLKHRRDQILKKAGVKKGGQATQGVVGGAKPKVKPDKPVTKVTAPVTATLPPPPQITSKSNAHHQKKFDALYAAATGPGSQQDKINAVLAVKTNATSKQTYTKKAHAYKQELMNALGGGSKPSETHKVPKPSKKPIKIDASSFPTKPTFATSNQQNKANNEKAIADAEGFAKKGDLAGLKSVEATASYKFSPKVKAYVDALKGDIAHQLNPPPPPKPISATLTKAVANIPSNPKGGELKVGFWSVVGDLGGLPQGVPEGKFQHASQAVKSLEMVGDKAYNKATGHKQAIKSYTGGGYHGQNNALRTGGSSLDTASGKAGQKTAKGIIKHGHTITPGLKTTRKYGTSTDAAAALKNLKPGQVISEQGILSTSTNPQVWSGQVHMYLTVGDGVKGMSVSKNSASGYSEQEIIYASNQRIMITKVEKATSSHKGQSGMDAGTVVHGVILPTHDNQCCPP